MDRGIILAMGALEFLPLTMIALLPSWLLASRISIASQSWKRWMLAVIALAPPVTLLCYGIADQWGHFGRLTPFAIALFPPVPAIFFLVRMPPVPVEPRATVKTAIRKLRTFD
jgi:hypothetical protein